MKPANARQPRGRLIYGVDSGYKQVSRSFIRAGNSAEHLIELVSCAENLFYRHSLF